MEARLSRSADIPRAYVRRQCGGALRVEPHPRRYELLIELLTSGTFDMEQLVPWLQTIVVEVKLGVKAKPGEHCARDSFLGSPGRIESRSLRVSAIPEGLTWTTFEPQFLVAGIALESMRRPGP